MASEAGVVVSVSWEAAAAAGPGLMHTGQLCRIALRSVRGHLYSLRLILKGEELIGTCLARLFTSTGTVCHGQPGMAAVWGRYRTTFSARRGSGGQLNFG